METEVTVGESLFGPILVVAVAVEESVASEMVMEQEISSPMETVLLLSVMLLLLPNEEPVVLFVQEYDSVSVSPSASEESVLHVTVSEVSGIRGLKEGVDSSGGLLAIVTLLSV